MTCANCGTDRPIRRCHCYLSTDEVVELALCDECRAKFGTADWVRAVI